MINTSSLENVIEKNLDSVNNKIYTAAKSAGRKPEDIKLIVVSKKQPVNVVQAAINVGIRNFGENYPEQSIEKIETFENVPDIQWHMIGHLQSRKIKIVTEKFQYLQSLDSLTLAKKLNQTLAQEKKILPVLLQFNVGGEISKHGWNASEENTWDELLQDVSEIIKLPFLEIRGLMTMPPLELENENAKKYFKELRMLQEFFKNYYPQQFWQELSMGTSGDYEAAIQEGATMIRIGQAILGPRI